MKHVLVTGGAGYVGAHTCKAFAEAGWRVSVLDNLCRGFSEMVRWGDLIDVDLLDRDAVASTLETVRPDLVVHFAALAYVQESVVDPALYYRTNLVGAVNLLDAMRGAHVDKIIFSSTCASYGVPGYMPIDEAHPQHPINPYGWSKLFVERMLIDHAAAYGLSSVALRYFNAAGADPDGEIGERHEPETHAIPLAIAAALDGGTFGINGSTFATRDGSAVRDYIHVADLADAHVKAATFSAANPGFHAFNLGSGTGTSLLEMLRAVEAETGAPIDIRVGLARDGDPAELVADSAKAQDLLGWVPRRSDIASIVADAVGWAKRARPDHAPTAIYGDGRSVPVASTGGV